MKKLLWLCVLALVSLASAQFEGKPICFALSMASDKSGFSDGVEFGQYSRKYLRDRGVDVTDETFIACDESKAVPLLLVLGHPPDKPKLALVGITGDNYELVETPAANDARVVFDKLLDKLAETWLEQNP